MTNILTVQRDPAIGVADLIPVTPSDTVDVQDGYICTGLLLTAAGTLKLTMADGVTTRTLPSGALAPNVIHRVCFRRVWATGTTATVWAGV